MGRWQFRGARRGIRWRTTWAATLVVAVALVGASVALVWLQRQQLVNGLTEIAKQQGEVIASQIEEGGPSRVNVKALESSVGDSSLLQVVASDGRVLVTSDDDYAALPLTDATPELDDTIVRTVSSLPHDDEPFVIVVLAVQTPEGAVRVIAAQSLDTVQQATAVLVTLLTIGLPAVVALVSVTSYVIVARALAPVEAIRRRVAAVSSAEQDARVPVPDTGDEIALLAETMNSMLSRLQAAAAEQHRFVADASHELRTPLATIRTTTELATLHPDALDRDTASTLVLAETGRLERLVSDLLLLARSDELGLAMHVEDVDLDDIVTGEVARLRASAGVRVDVDVRSVQISGDAQHLLRAVRNLMDNAARHARTAVGVRLRAEDRFAVLDITDDGPGIPEDQAERVFERFVRLDDSRERGTGGTGLGLAICRQIARAHGGDVRVIVPSAHGAWLRVTLARDHNSDPVARHQHAQQHEPLPQPPSAASR